MLSVSYIIQESIDKRKKIGNKLKLLFSDLYIMHFPIAFLGDENFTAQRDQNDPREVKARFCSCFGFVSEHEPITEVVKNRKSVI